MVTIRVLFFGSARSLIGGNKERSFVWSDRDRVSIALLVSTIMQEYPLLQSIMDSLVIAVNMEYTDIQSQQLVTDKDEIAFIPPLAGG